MESDTESQDRIKTTERIFQIVELLMREDGLSFTEVANHLDLSRSSAYRHLTSLERQGYVIKESEKYYPGMQFLDVGEYVRTRKSVYEMIEPKIEKLAERTDERAEFIVEEHGTGIFVHREVGENAVHTNTRIGRSIPLHASAAGKAILAHYPTQRVEEIVESQGLEELTQHTITDADELLDELTEIRETSIAYNDQELIEGLRAVGVPILDGDDVIGGISITGPTSRFQGEKLKNEYPDLLLGVANELELNIAFRDE
ncbi:IclR family transcriptional regulator [Natrinema ejinorense]|uniref:Transcriptional regulator n=1 Tax=Natrinema ejinorense TaxID=373386 RepID=A0A2A5QPY7_9EURY|nr:IclR family transcriptional regulator [Natrinema ejinorense]PCR88882.1 transcriptional regulator [Natrinema ejinorense]